MKTANLIKTDLNFLNWRGNDLLLHVFQHFIRLIQKLVYITIVYFD